MKKFAGIVAAGLVLALGFGALYGCGSSSSSNEDATSDDAKTLIVGFDAEYPPYGYLADAGADGYEASDGNTYTGFDLDLAAEVCERQGWTLQVEPIDWDAKDALLDSGQITCIWNGFTIEGREDGYAFTDPYMLNAQVVVVKAGSEYKSLDDLAGKNVLTQAGSAALELFEEDGEYADASKTFAGGAIQTIKDYNQAFMQLESGAIDAVCCDLSVAMTQMNANDGAYEQIQTLSEEHYGAGFKLGDEETAATVTSTLKEMYADGTVEEIAKKYGDDIDMNNWCLE